MTLAGLNHPSDLKEITVYVFKYGIKGQRWSQSRVKNLSIRSVMPNLVGKDASFAFLAYLVQEISIFLVFNIPLAAISDLKAKIILKT